MKAAILALALAGCLDMTVTGSTVAGRQTVTSGGSSGSSSGDQAATTAGSSTGGASSSGSTSGLPATSSAGSSTGAATSSGTTTGAPLCNGVPLSPAPPDAGPMFSFNGNPVLNDGVGEDVTSLAGWPATCSTDRRCLSGDYTILLLATDGGSISSSPFEVTSYITWPGFTMSLIYYGTWLSLASDQDGRTLYQQLYLDDAGDQACTLLDQPCGSHGPCCVGLSCQASDGGCSCEYAWPTN